MSNFYIKSLDGIRGIAVLLVIVYHFSKIDFIQFDFEIGWVGVQLFFVLSGYLITRILVAEKSLDLQFYLKRFYWRRTLRIFPIYFLYVIGLWLIFELKNVPENFDDAAPYLFTYTYNYSILSTNWVYSKMFSHLWSLSVEEQFYMLWPILVYMLSIKNLQKLCIYLIIAIPAFRLLLSLAIADHQQSDELIGVAVYWIGFSHMDAFASGGLLTIISTGSMEKLLKYRWIPWALFILSGSINLFLYKAPTTSYELSSLGYLLPSIENFQHVWSFCILNYLFAVIILDMVKNGSRIMSNSILVYIGKISYGMYLFHYGVIVFLEKVLDKPIINEITTLVICVILIIIISTLSYYLFESYFLRLKGKKFSLKRETRNI